MAATLPHRTTLQQKKVYVQRCSVPCPPHSADRALATIMERVARHMLSIVTRPHTSCFHSVNRDTTDDIDDGPVKVENAHHPPET